MIKVILMDLGGVYFTNGKKEAIKKASKKFSLSPKKMNDAISQKSYYGGLWRKGRISEKEFAKGASKKLKITTETMQDIIKIWHNSYKPHKGMRKIVRKLRENYKVVILSGNTKERVKYVDRKFKFEEEFDRVLYSFTLKLNKPKPSVFKAAVKKLRVKPENCLVVDDNKQFISAVRKLNANAILFSNPKQLIRDLKKSGVKI